MSDAPQFERSISWNPLYGFDVHEDHPALGEINQTLRAAEMDFGAAASTVLLKVNEVAPGAEHAYNGVRHPDFASEYNALLKLAETHAPGEVEWVKSAGAKVVAVKAEKNIERLKVIGGISDVSKVRGFTEEMKPRMEGMVAVAKREHPTVAPTPHLEAPPAEAAPAAAAMPAPVAPKEVHPGTLYVRNGQIGFEDAFHPGSEAAQKKVAEASLKLQEKLAASPDYLKEMDAAMEALEKSWPKEKLDKMKALQAQSHDLHDALHSVNHADFDMDLMVKMREQQEAITRKFAPEEFKAAQAAQQELYKFEHEIHAAQFKVLEGMKSAEGIAEADFGKAVENYKSAISKGNRIAGSFTEAEQALAKKASSWFGILRTESAGAAIKNNFSSWGKGIASVIFTGAGAALTVDAFARSQKKDENEQMVDRSWAARVSEGVVGLAGIGAGLFRGHR